MPTSKKVWISLHLPYSLISVAGEAVATQNHNVICFTDIKSGTDLNYHASTVADGCGVSVVAGHPTLGIFAFAEKTLRPIIRVVNYPEFSILSEFHSPDVIAYTDLCFSRTEHLIAQTSYPNYTIRVLNYRLNQVLVELQTHKICIDSLLCSNAYLPTIVASSYRKLYFYDLCYHAEGYSLIELPDLPLSGDLDWSDMCNKCFTEDNSLYMVNDYGDIINVDIGLFSLNSQWLMPRKEDFTAPRRYILQNAKRGLLIANSDDIYFIKRKGNEWQEEFKILNVQNTFMKIITDCNGDSYMTNSYSNIYSIENIDGKGILKPIVLDRFEVIDYAIVQGVNEEIVILATSQNELAAFNLLHMTKLSQFTIDNITHLCSYQKNPFIVAGTEKNQLHFLSYKKVSEPILLGSIDLDIPLIKTMNIFQNLVIIRDVLESIIIVKANFQSSHFLANGYFDKPIPEMQVLNCFIINELTVIVLFTLENIDYSPHANQMFLYKWSPQSFMLAQRYELPFNYVNFTISLKNKDVMFELYGARSEDIIIDVFCMSKEGSLKFANSIKTQHCNYIYNIAMNRHLITSSVCKTFISLSALNKSKASFSTTKLLDLKFAPCLPIRIEECFSGKYLLSLHTDKCFQVQKLIALTTDLKDNTFLTVPTELEIIPIKDTEKYIIKWVDDPEKPKLTEEEINKRMKLSERIAELAAEVTELIDYDISVAGITPKIFGKFCLNLDWLEKVKQEAEILCTAESYSIEQATQEQSRIRDWLLKLLFTDTVQVSSKIRALFTNNFCENYSDKKKSLKVEKEFNLFRFHDMDEPDDELDELLRESHIRNSDEKLSEEEITTQKTRNLYIVQGNNVLAHCMADEFMFQSKYEVSYFEMHNTCSKFKLSLNNPLKIEFNKIFKESVELKQQIMENIMSTNNVLFKIYDNMNIMRRLLLMEPFPVPELSVPQWTRDENVESILTVDDSEIKAVNRRKKKAEMAEIKSGRMLLWSIEFWERALINMMDGVLEKLWEEEIKKDIPVPEFVFKKDIHEFSITEQRQYREYLEKVRLLELDRRKYLVILNENDVKTKNLKNKLILKLNERISTLSIEKLQYDFALKRIRLQLINTKIIHFKRIQYIYTLQMLRDDYDKISKAIISSSNVCGQWEKSVADMKNRLEVARNRERIVERNFRSYFLNTVPSQFIPELRRSYKKIPKINKAVITILICDLIKKLVVKKGSMNISTVKPVEEFLNTLDELDSSQNMPHQFDSKQWEHFVKLRRQKVENEYTVKAISLKLLDIQNAYNRHLKNQNSLKTIRSKALVEIDKTKNDYVKLLHNRSLVVTLTLGQVEVRFSPSTRGIQKSVLMRVQDINEVNAKIKEAGLQKLRAMQRVAKFRRQVISKEWEHEVTKANIAYLKYMLEVIEKSKVTKEFLNVLRNWDKVKPKGKSAPSLALINKAIQIKINAANTQLYRYIDKIEETQHRIKLMKKKNSEINEKIEQKKIEYAFTAVYRDDLQQEKRVREQRERMKKIKEHRNMLDTIRADYARILELKAILELQRLRTYPTLGPAPHKMSTSQGSLCL